MHRHRIVLVGLSLLAVVGSGCSTSYGQRVEGASKQVEIAEALGDALAGLMIGLGSDGQVVANAAPESVRPSNECRDAELLNLQAAP